MFYSRIKDPIIKKFFDPNWQYKKYSHTETDLVVFHLGGTYLLSAEAHFMAGNEVEAINSFNAVRERAATVGNEG
ncbi:MAG: RagB/SusD family nutrient uptake outer membrane protein [Balneolaceae bacterium]|nr:RagB/SusD family nutrient uptake outer membrane protein [Balneolaceae bacterium]